MALTLSPFRIMGDQIRNRQQVGESVMAGAAKLPNCGYSRYHPLERCSGGVILALAGPGPSDGEEP